MDRSSGTLLDTEEEIPGPVPHLARRDWTESFPWMVHGVTHRAGRDFDLRFRGPAPAGEILGRWDALRDHAAMTTVVHAHQVHGAAVRCHRAGGPGLLLASDCDGHVTGDPGVLLTVSVADCVPVFLVAPRARVVALLHAGWRGVAAGIVEAGVAALKDRYGVPPEALHAHLGPAISRDRYEVGPEVHRAVGLPDPGSPARLDLREVVATRLRGGGVPGDRIGVSGRCTFDDPLLFSHRGGDGGRQVAFVGLVDRSGASR